MPSFISREPVAFGAGLLVIVAALFAVLASFKGPITGEQQSALTALITAIVGLWTRARVTPTSKTPPSTGAPPADDAPPTPRTGSVPPAAAMVGLALFVACSGAQKPPPGCGEIDYASIAATCGNDADICDAAVDERQRECDEKIKAGQ